MSVSLWFSDDELISQLESFFTDSELAHIDFRSVLGQIVEVDEDIRQVRIKGRLFQFSMVNCNVMEVGV